MNLFRNNFNVQVLIRILLLSCSLIAGCLCSVFIFGISILQILELIRFLNRPLQSLKMFYESVQNKDSTFNLPLNNKNILQKELNSVLNLVNQTLKNHKIESEQRERYLLFLIEHSSSGLITINMQTLDIEIINQTARNLLDIEHTTNLKRLQVQQPDLYQVITQNQISSTPIKIVKQNQILYLSVRISELNYAEQHLKIVSLNSIDSELESKEIESWHKLSKILTHEIMNSIAPITSLSSALLRNINTLDTENIINGLEVIEERSKGLTEFVMNYRKLTKVATPEKITISVCDFLDKISILMSEKLKDNNVIFIPTIKNVTEFLADENQITHVVINLINNAIDALENVEIKRINFDIASINPNQISINITDNGCGISPEVIENLFVPFFTTKESGSGIGLSLAQQIVKRHGGRIIVKSVVGKGSTFSVVL